MSQSDEKKPNLASERVEIGMEIAFGAQGESVLDALERLTGVTSRVLLSDPAGDDSPVVRIPGEGEEAAAGDDHRYQVLGEIARGGVGVILKSRDRDLGRDVALKVLRKDLARVPEVVQRFVEEAQIGGQLQHPGVVPVYGLGVQRDGRPYFAMKLVKGKTLAALIRDGTESSRPRLLSIFERVCQTVAYAHARKVIHRDLKPANVLVGNFGETQVVDWGFAKVLGQGGLADEHRKDSAPELSVIETIRSGGEGSPSQVGSIMGTPAYMPPEQARGDVESIDERADVFSLGAVLTEVLTGKPPYTGSAREQILKAAGAKLDDAKARLAGCGADRELIDLAERCLSPARDARPRHAGEVAEGVTAYLASLEEKKQEAELKAASAQRTRRLTLALAGAILLAVVVGGGGFILVERAERDRLERADAAVNAALREAGVGLGEARKADVEDLSPWPALVQRANKAVALAGELGADEETREAADGFLARVIADEEAARRAAALAAGDRRLSNHLWEVRLLREPFEPREGFADYGAALREHGLDLDAVPPEQAADWVRGRTIRDDIVAALDDWAHRRREEGEDATRLMTVLGIVDPDPLHGRIRAVSAKEDLEALEAIRDAQPLEELSSRTLRLLGEALGNAGDAGAAAEVHRVLSGREPNDFGTCLGLGNWLIRRTPPGVQEAISLFGHAAAMRRDCVAVRVLLAGCYGMTKMLDGQIACWREVHALAPEYCKEGLTNSLAQKAQLYWRAGNFGAAVEVSREAVQVDGERAVLWGSLAYFLVLAGRPAEAEEAALRAVELEPDCWAWHAGLADARRLLWRREEALASYDRGIELYPRSSRLWQAKGMALAGLGRLEEAIACWRKAARLQPGFWHSYSYIGEACLRLGRPEEAIGAFREVRRLAPDWAQGCFWLSHALRDAGKPGASREEYDRGVEMICRDIAAGVRADSGEQHMTLGVAAGKRFEADEAVRFWEERFPAESDGSRSMFLLGLANSILNRRLEPEVARGLIEEAMRLDPKSYRGPQELGFLLTKTGHHEEALACHRKAVELSRGTGITLYCLQAALGQLGRYREVLELERRRDELGAGHESETELFRRHLELEARVEEIRSGRLEPVEEMDRYLFSFALHYAGHFEEAFSQMEQHLAERERHPNERREVDKLAKFHQTAALIAARGAAVAETTEQGEWRRRTLHHLTRWIEAMERRVRFMHFPSDEGPDLMSGQLANALILPMWSFLRDEEAVAGLPPAEQAACRELWTRVRALWRKNL